ncbi:MAG: iron ABC transporter permease [Xanthobacteraceae bacterium]|nr:iron ABC transporter permease [Xanthobacteraceae bacterium]QYK45440.1 MAG: iron ABC transporter permease [Xanthobacteraceae bacterium]
MPSRYRRMFRAREASGWIFSSLLIAAIVVSPIVALAAFASQGSGDLWPSLIAYVLPQASINTVLLLGGVGITVSVIGVGTAWLVATARFPGRAIFEWALLLPFAIPTYIIAYAYLDILHPLGPIQSGLRALFGITNPRDLHFPDVRAMWGAILLLGFVLYPYVYLAARATFLMQTASALEVARTLGAGRAEIFFRIALPLARPAIIVGVTLAMLEALNDIGATEFLGTRTLTVSIYSTWLNRSSLPGAAQISLMMLVLVVALFLLERWARRHQRFAGNTRRAHPLAPTELRGWKAAGAFAACALPILIGFILPAAYLSQQAAERISHYGLSPQIFTEAKNTLLLAGAATLVTLLCGLVIAYTARAGRGALAWLPAKIASVGYAIPGTVLAVGLLGPMAAFDNTIDAFMRQTFGISTGLLISGTGGALILAYMIRFLAISINGIESGYAKIPASLDNAARSLGEPAAGVMRRIHLPLLRPALGAAAILVFVDCMKELPATLMLRPFGVETLSTHVYAEAVRGTYEDGAVAALLIVLAGLIPVILLARLSRAAVDGFSSVSGDQVRSAAMSR